MMRFEPLLQRVKRDIYRTIAAEISVLSRFANRVLYWPPQEFDSGILFEQIQANSKFKLTDEASLPDLHGADDRTLIVMNGTFNYHLDIQQLLTGLRPKLSRHSRLAVVLYNPYLEWIYKLVSWLGLRKGTIPTTFITYTDLVNISRLSGYELVRTRPAVCVPFPVPLLGDWVNRIVPVVPVLRWLCLVSVIVLRPVLPDAAPPSLSIIVPAKDEKGNIEAAVTRLPDFGATQVELIFVEGHSSDGTWEEIERVQKKYKSKIAIRAHQQKGRGKNDAVRTGIAHARHELVTILDADLTMPPEMLVRFHDAYRRGDGDFINGNRLVYPMETDAMRFLNRVGNTFFAKLLGFNLGVRIGDALCGTKLLSRRDYDRIVAWRQDFGDFDPFGDFELLFGASVLALGTVDIPIRYRARVYGTTNISRFRHGLMLLRMSVIGFFRLKLARVR
jgi:hypothetical protein